MARMHSKKPPTLLQKRRKNNRALRRRCPANLSIRTDLWKRVLEVIYTTKASVRNQLTPVKTTASYILDQATGRLLELVCLPYKVLEPRLGLPPNPFFALSKIRQSFAVVRQNQGNTASCSISFTDGRGFYAVRWQAMCYFPDSD